MSQGTCTIFYPGLLGPSIALDELDSSAWPDIKTLPTLQYFLSHGKSYAFEPGQQQGMEARILDLLGVARQNKQLPIADLRRNYHGQTDVYQWCLDPVYIQIDLDEALLHAGDELLIDEQDARQIIADINRHFVEDDLYIEYCTPQHWLLKAQLELETRSLSEVLYRNVNDYLPQGSDAPRWQRILNEIQMLLYTHPVNDRRQAKGKLPINSLWLWGNGTYNSIETPVEFVCSDNELALQAASLSAIANEFMPRKPNMTRHARCRSLIVLTAQMAAIRRNDVFGWFAALEYLDRHILAPLLVMLRQGQLERIEIHSDRTGIMLDRAATRQTMFSWVMPKKSIQKLVTQLRHQYAY